MDKDLRIKIFRQTVEMVNSGGYVVNGKEVAIDREEVIANTVFFDAPFSLKEKPHLDDTNFSAIEADCLEVAQLLVKAGYNPCVLNMASGRNPGGGVLNGSGAQEENIFRRSNLFASLYQFAGYAEEYGIVKSAKQYPLDRNHGGIYSQKVTVFRSSENTGYALLDAPFQISVVSVPAINRPELETVNGQLRIAPHLIEPTKEKMRTILRIAGKYGHNALVLSAFGCGAFCNPPEHIALLFKEVFAEMEFENRFYLVVFAIISDNNSNRAHNPKGNFEPFREVFKNSSTLLYIACRKLHIDIVKSLLKNGAEADSDCFLVMFRQRSVRINELQTQIELSKLLFNKNTDVNTKSREGGNTALMYVAKYRNRDDFQNYSKLFLEKQTELLDFLLDNGADINAVNKEGKTAMMGAKEVENQYIVDYLFKKICIK